MRIILLAVLSFFLVQACTDDEFSDFCFAVLENDANFVRDEVNDILDHWDPEPTQVDGLGHEDNLYRLVDELNEEYCLEAFVLCYACIETAPPQSELLVRVYDGYNIVEKVFDILTPNDGPMTFVAMHD